MLHARACYVHDSYTYTMYIHHIQILDVHMYNTTVFSHHEQGHTPQAQSHNEKKHTASTPRARAHYKHTTSTSAPQAHHKHTKSTPRARAHHKHTAITRQHNHTANTPRVRAHSPHTSRTQAHHDTHQKHARNTNTP